MVEGYAAQEPALQYCTYRCCIMSPHSALQNPHPLPPTSTHTLTPPPFASHNLPSCSVPLPFQFRSLSVPFLFRSCRSLPIHCTSLSSQRHPQSCPVGQAAESTTAWAFAAYDHQKKRGKRTMLAHSNNVLIVAYDFQKKRDKHGGIDVHL